jgi:hypothetical protein
MVVAMGRLWHDPVWSKVIAASITGVAAVLYAWIGNQWLPQMTTFNWWLFAIALLGVLGGLAGGFLIFRKLNQVEPNITKTGVRIPPPDPDRKLTFPLKCYVTLRNDSEEECADVHLSDYKRGAISVRELPSDVLQVRIGTQWCPSPDGIARVAVLPKQRFRAWIGLDHTLYNQAQANDLLSRGQLGTLVFSVNGKLVNVELKL